MKKHFFPFHIVDKSPWPLYCSISILCTLTSYIGSINLESSWVTAPFPLSLLVLSLFGWMRDISSEGLYQGSHTLKVQKGIKMGMVMFIVSEVLFFASFFWGLFYVSFSPSVEIFSWPPSGIDTIDPLGLPLLGTMVLLSSGFTVTWGHFSVLQGSWMSSCLACMMTLVLGCSFLGIQACEYWESSFSINDSVYGSVFFMTTGFHGFHVMVGVVMIIISTFRLAIFHMTKTHHLGLESSIWYWHFVDVVWLFLYLCLYWGSTT
nr:cytochrome c oxidase subunit 3 [Austromenopon atrofulvum]